MKKIFQSLRNGKTELIEIPSPSVSSGNLLIKSYKTLISSGTERMLVDFGRSNIIQKGLKQPDKVKKIIEKISSDGIKPTIDSIFSKLDQPLPLGYCNVGKIVEKGSDHSDFEINDRVVSNGHHSEFVKAPFNLCAKIPDNVSDDEASFTVLGSIALQGIRLVSPTLGETVVVTGLGLIGLLTVQLLKAHGCRVIAIDFDQARCNLAKSFGAEVVNLSKGEDPIKAADVFSRHRGVDAVIISASTTSNEPVSQAAKMCRKKGRIVLVGVSGLNLSRDDFYEKELSFQVSCSYGPGRYDSNYEDNGNDYPLAYVRWTEQRNFEAVLDLMSSKSLDVKKLISHSFDFEEAAKAYDLVFDTKDSLGIILNYSHLNDQLSKTLEIETDIKKSTGSSQVNVSFVGAGNYTSKTILPKISKNDVNFIGIGSENGMSGTLLGKKYGFKNSTTDIDSLINDSSSNTIFITTRHDTHSDFVIKALKANKNVFVEKPLCIKLQELNDIKKTYLEASKKNKNLKLMVGFNRRFSPQIEKIKSLLKTSKEKASFIMTVNSGYLPKDHWTQDKNVGGGRIVGEACHFLDLLLYLSGGNIESWSSVKMKSSTNDTLSISLEFDNGSIGCINYFSNGPTALPKERLEVFTGNKGLILDNFKKLKGYGWKNFKKLNLWNQDKGQDKCFHQFISSIKDNSPSPISFEDIFDVTKLSIEISELEE